MISSNWKKNIIKDNSNIKRLDNSEIYSYGYAQNKGTQFHENMPKGAALREFKDIHHHLSYWETPFYKKALDKFLDGWDNLENKTAIDIGCGDGRFTEYLIEKGFGKVIAIDAHLKPLESLLHYAKEKNYEDRLMIIHCSADNIPVIDGEVDLALAIGVFYYSNDKYEDCLSEVRRILKPSATLINSEPDLEGAVYKSIFFEELEDMIENYKNRLFKEEKGKTEFKFRLFEREELKKLLNKNGFSVVDFHGLSLLPSILRIKMVREEFSKNEIIAQEEKIKEVFDYFDNKGSLFKHVIWKSTKSSL